MHPRRALAVVLCLLLASLQTQVLVHPLAHLGHGEAKQTGLASDSLDAHCLQCAMLAGGATGSVAHATTFDAGDGVYVVDPVLRTSRTADAPAWFQSRAPPVSSYSP